MEAGWEEHRACLAQWVFRNGGDYKSEKVVNVATLIDGMGMGTRYQSKKRPKQLSVQAKASLGNMSAIVGVDKNPSYSWFEDEDLMTIELQLPPNTNAKAIDFLVRNDQLKVSLRNGPVLLTGRLLHFVGDESTWTKCKPKWCCLS